MIEVKDINKINYEKITLNFFNERIRFILYYFPNYQDVTSKIIDNLSKLIHNKNECFVNEYEEISRSIYNFLENIFGGIPLSFTVINEIMEYYDNFINFVNDLKKTFSFDSSNLSEENISNTINFLNRVCFKENFDIRINYYSNKKTWNTFFFDISSDAIHGLTERKSFKASAFDFLIRNPNKEYKLYISHINNQNN